jgi:hypothetical protein
MRSHRPRSQDLERAEVRLLQGWSSGPSRPPLHTWRLRPPDLLDDPGHQKEHETCYVRTGRCVYSPMAGDGA